MAELAGNSESLPQIFKEISPNFSKLQEILTKLQKLLSKLDYALTLYKQKILAKKGPQFLEF